MPAVEQGGRLLQQNLEDAAEIVDVRGAVFARLLPEAARAEAVDHGERGLADEREYQELRAADMVERLPHQEHVSRFRGGDEGCRLAGKPQHAVRDDDALGLSGGARGVHDRERIVGAGKRLCEAGAALEECFEPERGFGLAECQERQIAQGSTTAAHRRRELGIRDHEPRLRMLENVAQALAAQLHVDRHPYGPRASQTEEDGKRLGAVAQHHGDAVSARDPQVPQAASEGLGPACRALRRRWARH